MVHNYSPTTRYENQVTGGNNGFSTLHRDVARGGTFSAGLSREQARRLDVTAQGEHPQPRPEQTQSSPTAAAAPPAPLAPLSSSFAPSMHQGFSDQSYAQPGVMNTGFGNPSFTNPGFGNPGDSGYGSRRLPLVNNRFPGNAFVAPGGFAANLSGLVEFGPGQVTLQLDGLGPLPDPSAKVTPWLIADLLVPADLDPQDLALLPRVSQEINLPGSIFSIDGQPPTIGRADIPIWNAIGIAVKPGELQEQQGRYVGHWQWDDRFNWALHPVALLGPHALGNHPAALPSGITMNLLTDLFLRPATVYPELPLRTQFAQRLWQIWQRHLALWDRNRDGLITAEDLTGQTGAFLSPEQFQRVAVTLEPTGQRATPVLLPTQQACLAVGLP